MSLWRGRKARAGFTLVEAIIGVMLASILLTIVYRVFRHINYQRVRGTVDLQELQGARYAINFLRRDFRCASPKISSSATYAQKLKAVRVPAVKTQAYTPSGGPVPILVSDSEIHFFRQKFDTPETSTTPAYEEVNYRVDATRKCLIRASSGKEEVFDEIKGARFELYAHPLQPDVPMLLVTLLIDATKDDLAGGPGFLELTTTISSAVANQNLNNPFWHRIYY